MNWQKERFSQKQLTSESFDNDNKLTLKSFFAFCSVFFTRTNGRKMETTSRQTLGAIHSTKIQTGLTGKRGPPQKVDLFFETFSGWTEPIHWVLDRNFRKFWLNGSRPQCPVSKILQRYIKELKLTVPFVMWYCFRAPTKTSFFDACQMSVKSCVLHLFPVPQTGRSHIINILLASFFSVRTVNYGSSFFSIDLWRLGHKSMEKKLSP